MGPHVVCCPAFGLPAVKIASLCSGVHHEVDGAASTECASTWYNWLSISELRCLVTLVEECGLGCRLQVLQIENWVDDVWDIFIVCATLNHEDAEVGGSFSDARCNDTSCCAT